MNNFKMFTDFMGGRTTFFLSLFAIAGIALQWMHRLDTTFVSFMAVHMGYVLGHSYKEDVHAENTPPKP